MSRRGSLAHATVIPLLAIFAAGVVEVMSVGQVAAASIKESSAGTPGQQLIKGSDCAACHAASKTTVGPSYNDIAKRYKGQPDAVAALITKIRLGGSGNWGTLPMTPHPALTDDQLKEIVKWILSLGGEAPAPAEAPAKLYSFTLADGTTVKLDFPLFVEGQQPKVTKAVFHGYEDFNSYCYRCHGQDAMGGELAPDLKHSLSVGMTAQQFLSVAMVGRVEKGMPSWAGFLSDEEVKQIYQYVKGRSVDLIPVGRPSSELD